MPASTTMHVSNNRGWVTPRASMIRRGKPVAIRKAPEGKLVAQKCPVGSGDGAVENRSGSKNWVRAATASTSDRRFRDGSICTISRERPGQRIDIKYICESPVGSNSYTLSGRGDESYHTPLHMVRIPRSGAQRMARRTEPGSTDRRSRLYERCNDGTLLLLERTVQHDQPHLVA